jgi:hypothetical protein
MMSFRPKRKFTRFALAATLGMAVVMGCAGTFAHAADDDDDELLDTKILKGIMKGLGLRKDEAGIEYRERSPLVLPPNNQLTVLPSPEDVANSKKAANWPDDPDIKRVKQRREQERKRKPQEPGVDDKALSPSQMMEGKPTAGPTIPRGGEAPGKSEEGSTKPSTNAELGSKGFLNMFKTGLWAPKEEYTPFTGEPQRSSLTEPPRGYRTPSPNQPYGVGKEKWKAPTIDRNEPVK